MNSAASLTVVETGPLTTVQDAGRLGQGALDIGRSGACGRASYRLANRLVGNDEGNAGLECTLGGLVLRADTEVILAITGARCPGTPHNTPMLLSRGQQLELAAPVAGVRTYIAVRGEIEAISVLGSRSTDLLAGLGPEALTPGERLRVGDKAGALGGVGVPERLDQLGVDEGFLLVWQVIGYV